MTTPTAADGTPLHFTDSATGEGGDGAVAGGGGIELFPVNFTTYRHHEDVDTDRHVQAVANLLADYGAHTTEWTVPPEDRDRQAVETRLRTWKQPGGGRNTLLYWVGHGTADYLAHHGAEPLIDDGVNPQDIAGAISSRQLHPDNADSWAIVVLDACFSTSFARAVHRALFDDKHTGVRRYLLLATAARGYAELGAFSHALRRALHITFPTQRAIGLSALGRELARHLDGFLDDLTIDDHHDQLVSLRPNAASAVTGPLDQLAELQTIIDQLPDDERRHFLPKATGAELGELAWYFHGRTLQRNQILHWLTTARQGALIVTGPAGAGKSALLGHVLLHTNSSLRETLTRHGHLTPLPAGIPCPDNPFDLTLHLAGLTPARVLHLIAHTAGLPHLAQQSTDGTLNTDLTTRLLTELRERPTPLTLLVDALDEADQPLVIADQILRPLAALPRIRLVIGTRRSTHEGPDHPTPDDTDILDTLRPAPTRHGSGPTVEPEHVEVAQDLEAIAGYLDAKLRTAARRRGTLEAEGPLIAPAVHRLVTAHPKSRSTEPQQFLYARLAAHELLNTPHLLTDPTPLLGLTHRQLFTRALERLGVLNPHYTPLLKALGLAQGRGLPDQDDIWAAMADALAPEPATTRDSVPGLLRDAAPYLALDHDNGQSVYRLAHRTFTEHFTTAPDADRAHAAITVGLTRHTLHHQGTPGTESQPEQVSPYTRRHLAAHARLGHTAGALHTLADHPQVLDLLDLAGITAAVLHHGLSPRTLPPAIAGTVLLQHHARGATTGWRQWWRRLGTTYIQGTPPTTEPGARTTGPTLPTLTGGTVRPRQLHLQLAGHTFWVRAVGVFAAADGSPRLATGGSDGTVRIWDPAIGTQVGEPFTGHAGAVWAVGVFAAADGSPRLATGGSDGTVRIWNPATGTQIGDPLTGHTDCVNAVGVFAAADGSARLAIGSADETVRIWDPATGTQIGDPLTGHSRTVGVVGVFVAADGTARLATGATDGTVRMWDPATGTQVGDPLTGHTNWVRVIGGFAAADGSPRLATGSEDGTVRIWDPATGTQIGDPLTGHTNVVNAVGVFAASDGSPRLATGSDDGTVRIWDPATAIQVGAPLTGHTSAVRAVRVFAAADGTARLATGSEDATVRIWDPATAIQVADPLTGHVRLVNAMGVFAAADGSPRLATGSDDGTVRIWDPATGTQIGDPLTGHTDWVNAVGVFAAADGSPRLATGGSHGTVRIWDPATGTQIGAPLTGHTGAVWAVGVFAAADGSPRLATGGSDGTVRIWDPATGTQIGDPLTGHTDWVNAVGVFAASDGSPRLATGSDDGTVRIWDPTTGTQIAEPLTGHTHWVRAVEVFAAADGSPRLATGGNDGTVRIWDPRTRTGYVLPLADRVYALTTGLGLLIVGTESGHHVIDLTSSRPMDLSRQLNVQSGSTPRRRQSSWRARSSRSPE
ncbi:AAA family ATPase [Streptomyces sp. NPDC057939]|uniref:AAA family ATPase n=1 Tax=Streptomyces sp. NPDC057939 TaxID=3346284 RepID=UPI0036E56113